MITSVCSAQHVYVPYAHDSISISQFTLCSSSYSQRPSPNPSPCSDVSLSIEGGPSRGGRWAWNAFSGTPRCRGTTPMEAADAGEHPGVRRAIVLGLRRMAITRQRAGFLPSTERRDPDFRFAAPLARRGSVARAPAGITTPGRGAITLIGDGFIPAAGLHTDREHGTRAGSEQRENSDLTHHFRTRFDGHQPCVRSQRYRGRREAVRQFRTFITCSA